MYKPFGRGPTTLTWSHTLRGVYTLENQHFESKHGGLVQIIFWISIGWFLGEPAVHFQGWIPQGFFWTVFVGSFFPEDFPQELGEDMFWVKTTSEYFGIWNPKNCEMCLKFFFESLFLAVDLCLAVWSNWDEFSLVHVLCLNLVGQINR